MEQEMTERDPSLESPPTAQESEMARRLAEAIESGTSGCADPRALSVVRLLESLSANPSGDDFATRRTRKELVARASRLRPRRVAGRFAAAAALVAVALTGALLLRSPERPSEQLLAQREKAARAAVASLAVFGMQDSGDARLRDQMDDLRTERFASALQSQRLTSLLNQAEGMSSVKEGTGTGKTPVATQNPGGAS
jgi:hypothetical protein